MMNQPVTGWILAALAVAMAVLAWGQFFAPLNHTSFGAVLVPAGKDARVVSVKGGSSAAQAGLRPGDTIVLAGLSLSDRLRVAEGRGPANVVIRLPVLRDGVRRIGALAAKPAEIATPPLFVAAELFSATISLLIIALIALRRPSLSTAALTLFAMGSVQVNPVTVEFSWIPDPWFGAVAIAIVALFGYLPLLALVPFITRFPEPPQTPAARLRMRIGDGIFLTGALVSLFASIFEPLLFRTWAAFDIWSQVALVVIVLAFTALAFNDASGESRRRIGWVFAGLSVSAIGYMGFDIADVLRIAGSQATIGEYSLALQAVLPIALAYAILRHRVLDIGFALNRTMVYGVTTALVVAVVSLVDWLTTRLLSEERLALAIEAAVTIGFGFALNWIHARTEKLIDRIVFRARHIAEKRIESRIGALTFAASGAAVDDALATDAPRILELQSAAIFRIVPDGSHFVCGASSHWPEGALAPVDGDSVLVRTLRLHERPIVLADLDIAPQNFPHGAGRPVIAIPIVAQHQLIAFALYGNRSDGALPDPEEISLLANLCAAAGNAYGVVEGRQLRERNAWLERSLTLTAPAGDGTPA